MTETVTTQEILEIKWGPQVNDAAILYCQKLSDKAKIPKQANWLKGGHMVGGGSTNRPCDQNVANGKGEPKGYIKSKLLREGACMMRILTGHFQCNWFLKQCASLMYSE